MFSFIRCDIRLLWVELCRLTRAHRTSAFASYGPKTAILLSADAVEKALDERREH